MQLCTNIAQGNLARSLWSFGPLVAGRKLSFLNGVVVAALPPIGPSPISVLASAIAEESEASPAFSDHVRMTDRVRVADGRRTVILQNWALTLK